MKIVGVICFMLVVFCSCQQQEKGYVVEGTITGLDTEGLFMFDAVDMNSGKNKFVEVKDGKFRFEGTCKVSTMMRVWSCSKTKKEEENYLGLFWLGSSNYKLNIDANNLDDVKLKVDTEDPNQKIFNDFHATEDKAEQFEIITKNCSHPAAVNRFYSWWARFLPISETKRMMKMFKGEAKASREYDRLEAFVYSKKDAVSGKPAKDFTIYGMDGKEESLLSKNGNLDLIYFYTPDDAAYPYRQIKELYKKYKDSPINFKGVCMNVTGQDWIRDAQFSGLPYPVYGTDLNWVNGVIMTYGVNSLPWILLVDKDGKIIESDGRSEANFDELIEKSL